MYKFLQESGKYCIRMPNKWNYSFDYYYAAFAVLGIYVPGINELFSYSILLDI